jgi:membrane glycosyltransferase
MAALCSMSTMALLAGAYVYREAVLPLAQALGTSASAGFVGALFGWCLVSAIPWAPGRTAQHTPVTKRRRYAAAAPQA